MLYTFEKKRFKMASASAALPPGGTPSTYTLSPTDTTNAARVAAPHASKTGAVTSCPPFPSRPQSPIARNVSEWGSTASVSPQEPTIGPLGPMPGSADMGTSGAAGNAAAPGPSPPDGARR